MTTEYAFPHENNHTYKMTGMTLRDYFAAKALIGLLQEANAHFADDAIAELAYQLADAMMEARK